jgi:Ca2+-binding EF-hand superfamily protein
VPQPGLSSNPSDIARFFPPSQCQTLTLPTFLAQLSSTLCSLSPPAELLSAFAAFDDDDSGQIDLAELRKELVHTASDPSDMCISANGRKAAPLTEREIDKIFQGFSGRRAFGKQSAMGLGVGKRGEVFRYREFVDAITGGKGGKDGHE